MSRDSYRDELQAAHARIAALERDLAHARGDAMMEALPAAISEQLRPGEVVHWHCQPDQRGAGKVRFWLFAGGWAFVLFWFGVLTVRGVPLRLAGPLAALLLAGGLVGAWRHHRALERARGRHYAITDSRLLLLEEGQDGVDLRSVPFSQCGVVTLSSRGGGVVAVQAREGEQPLARLTGLVDAKKVYGLLVEKTIQPPPLLEKDNAGGADGENR